MALSLLLADDSPTIAKILGMALQSEDYEIRSVLTADEAIRELRAKPPYFFLVDLSLPGKNGFEFAELIRGDSKLAKIKIVFLSSAFEPVDEDAVKKSGADLVIAKPFDPAELRNSLRQLRDAPPKFPSGAKVQGSLSGQIVVAPEGTNTSLTDTGLRVAREVIAGTAPKADDLLAGSAGELDANSILAGLGGDAPPPLAMPELGDTPPAPPPAAAIPEVEALDIDLGAPAEAPPPPPAPAPDPLDLIAGQGEQNSFNTNPVLDLTGAFTPPVGTKTNLASPAPPAPPAAGALSPNAEALAAFFAAEIESQQPSAPPPPPASVPAATPEDFEKSLASIEWDASAPADLDAWSAAPQHAPSPSAPPPAPKPVAAAPSPAPRPAAPSRETKPASAPLRTDQSAGPASFMFDTGDSNFRFAEDYITRITKSFTGQTHEEVPERHEPMFPQQSDDAPPASASAPAGLGGAWNPVDAEKMEQIVREEVQMAVREIVEKVAWEVIPELAENIIKRELDKVMKQLEGNS